MWIDWGKARRNVEISMIVQREPNEKSSNEDKEDIENLITVPNCFILISCGICEFLAVMVMCIGCSQIVPSFFILMLEKQGLANWPMGGIWLSACFFIGTQFHSFILCVVYGCHHTTMAVE